MVGIERYTTTAEALVVNLIKHSETLNPDTFQERPMPSIAPVTGCTQPFIEALRKHGFPNLAVAIAVVHRGEQRMKQDKGFLSDVQANKFRSCLKVIEDLSSAVSDNATLFNNAAQVDIVRDYRGGAGTTLGQIVLSFYDRYLYSIIGNSAMTESADLRVDTLSKQNGFVLSPIMRECIQIDKPVPVA